MHTGEWDRGAWVSARREGWSSALYLSVGADEHWRVASESAWIGFTQVQLAKGQHIAERYSTPGRSGVGRDPIYLKLRGARNILNAAFKPLLPLFGMQRLFDVCLCHGVLGAGRFRSWSIGCHWLFGLGQLRGV